MTAPIHTYNSSTELRLSMSPNIDPDDNPALYKELLDIRDSIFALASNTEARGYKYLKIVKTVTDLTNLYSDTLYVIDGEIDLAGVSIVPPAEGLSISGLGFGVSKILCTEDNFTAITSPGGGSGDIFIDKLVFDIQGTASKVFDVNDVTGFSTIELVQVNFENCTSIGVIDSYRQLFGNVLGIFSCLDGLEFKGSWVGGAKLINTIARGTPNVFKAGAGLTFGSRFFTDINIDLPAGTSYLANFSPSNFSKDSLFQLTAINITRNGNFNVDDANYLPNITRADTESLFTGCIGARNTVPMGTWNVSTPAATTVAVINTLYKLAGTTTYRDLIHTSNGGGNNSLTYDNSLPTEFEIKTTAEILGTAGDEIELMIRIYDSSAAGYVDAVSVIKPIVNYPGGTADRAVFTIFDVLDLANNDRVELWVRNLTAARNVTLAAGSIFNILQV